VGSAARLLDVSDRPVLADRVIVPFSIWPGGIVMAVFDTLTYVLDLRDRPNCSRIERAKPGEEIDVLVRPVHDPKAPSIPA
jgi:hypothetical protein